MFKNEVRTLTYPRRQWNHSNLSMSKRHSLPMLDTTRKHRHFPTDTLCFQVIHHNIKNVSVHHKLCKRRVERNILEPIVLNSCFLPDSLILHAVRNKWDNTVTGSRIQYHKLKFSADMLEFFSSIEQIAAIPSSSIRSVKKVQWNLHKPPKRLALKNHLSWVHEDFLFLQFLDILQWPLYRQSHFLKITQIFQQKDMKKLHEHISNSQDEGLEDRSLLSKHFQVLLHHENQSCCLVYHDTYGKWANFKGKRKWNKLFKFTLRRDLFMESASPSIKAPSSSILLSVQTTLFKNTNIGQHWANSSRPIFHRFCCFSSFGRWFQGFPSGAVVVQGV